MAYIAAHNIISPLGDTSAATFAAVLAGRSAVAEYPPVFAGGEPVWASKLSADWQPPTQLGPLSEYTRFEQLLIASIAEATAQTEVDLTSPRTVLVLATTKGNIGLLDDEPQLTDDLFEQLQLTHSSRVVAAYFGSPAAPMVVSNACISGVAALLVAQRLLASGQYDAAVVAGADTVSRFVLSGFQAFQALSAGPCRPFSEDRDGINLGEAAATMVLTATTPAAMVGPVVRLAGGAISNDANHISGPSRTGQELANAIGEALAGAALPADSVDFIAGHGTATPFNDAMEAKAFALAGVAGRPVSSVKGALGHTLGAAGLVESVLSVLALQHGQLLPTAGYSQPMQPQPLAVSAVAAAANSRVALKTASGFGGCNGALVFVRE
ncbi:beta-ketoacyl-[acyl-carrier-protein] synthase family protein [Hymenobacter sp. DH14]|uniref:Beta-ketoacyl-[acyl-carrier-protein] synthase family protein n=1 Tax=Hymenobacter cyanobacteriorum TaxID=2926463 RepID=A0A9X2ADP7_9BACT|nr:beta-ketoacyl synthase N-terminal-like domain-containing protein [Hymenobacter cyanobacteriorum]MCI1186381.1 beta-ketoacyl-[acyl-carrier-protein] synthase family protein [Hymenobacter cyanobacteriorum]